MGGMPKYEEKVWPKGQQKMEASLRRIKNASVAPFQKASGILPVPRRHNGSGCLSRLARNRGHSEQQFAASRVPLRPLSAGSPTCISSAGRRLARRLARPGGNFDSWVVGSIFEFV